MSITTTRRGDTIIEVMFAIVIFCLVSIISITLMNNGVSTAQASLELTMARNEIDAQAEALRFVQNSFSAERNAASRPYESIWHSITNQAVEANKLGNFPPASCTAADTYLNSGDTKAFILNTREVGTSPVLKGAADSSSIIQPTALYPRLIFGTATDNSDTTLAETAGLTTLRRAEGIWIIAVKGIIPAGKSQPEFYDFHIRTCWYAPGRSVPTTIATIIRLYNPEIIQ
jgi:type II secretory pathway pseudopilin PulG